MDPFLLWLHGPDAADRPDEGYTAMWALKYGVGCGAVSMAVGPESALVLGSGRCHFLFHQMPGAITVLCQWTYVQGLKMQKYC